MHRPRFGFDPAAIGHRYAQRRDRLTVLSRIGKRIERRCGLAVLGPRIRRDRLPDERLSRRAQRGGRRSRPRPRGIQHPAFVRRPGPRARARIASRPARSASPASPAAFCAASKRSPSVAAFASAPCFSWPRSARRLRCRSRCAAALGVPGARRSPSQRQRPPSRVTSRWPGSSADCWCSASAVPATTPICDSRRDSTAGAVTKCVNGCASPGKARS